MRKIHLPTCFSKQVGDNGERRLYKISLSDFTLREHGDLLILLFNTDFLEYNSVSISHQLADPWFFSVMQLQRQFSFAILSENLF